MRGGRLYFRPVLSLFRQEPAFTLTLFVDIFQALGNGILFNIGMVWAPKYSHSLLLRLFHTQ